MLFYNSPVTMLTAVIHVQLAYTPNRCPRYCILVEKYPIHNFHSL